ncbi:cytochrome d ubiquinol oxidase subunit II [Rothia terrae]|uniref:cytochrome d ubiquinol oxidase subunit II n=1 Tax=Rothia terrae TaxID=396015 RepID=UPI0014461CE8|nr:cytochrome d ubiquinol oxidase subunit II [Rothia terrae]NKZ34572.1 cytochrome d ubiquinol oxidase subunit II [Rothia terrae]
MEFFGSAPTLPTVWFVVVGFFWIGYIALDGFDLGVGMLMSGLFARNEKERRLLLNTIGPVWDGNEVWLVTAGASMFAAFPMWYAGLFSGIYLPLVFTLLALIFRAVAIEYRGKKNTERWVKGWTLAMNIGSFLIAFFIGAALAITATGLPLNANGDRVGGAFSWLSLPAIIGGLAFVGFAIVHALAFVALKTDGEIRVRARKALVRLLPVGVLPLLVAIIYMQITSASVLSLVASVISVVAVVVAWVFARAAREGKTFASMMVFIIFGMLSIFLALFPNVLPSTLDAANNLTVANASSSPYTLGLMSVVACFGIPVLLIYQSWTYWVFRKRLSVHSIPEAHDAADLATLPNAR